MVPTGQRWNEIEGARAFYTELFAAFPDNRFELTEIVVGTAGRVRGGALTGTTSNVGGGPRRGCRSLSRC